MGGYKYNLMTYNFVLRFPFSFSEVHFVILTLQPVNALQRVVLIVTKQHLGCTLLYYVQCSTFGFALTKRILLQLNNRIFQTYHFFPYNASHFYCSHFAYPLLLIKRSTSQLYLFLCVFTFNVRGFCIFQVLSLKYCIKGHALRFPLVNGKM